MNFVLNYLTTKGRESFAELVSTEAKDHSLPDDLALHADLDYKGPDGAPLAVDVYRPKDASADPLPIAMFVHGGGLFVGSRKANQVYVELLAQRGYVVFVPEYRLIDETNAIGSISDVCAGLSFLKDHAAEFGGDLNRVLVIGESAGGYLSLYATALLKSPQLRAELGIEPPDMSVRGLACFGGMFYTSNFDLIGLVYRRELYGEHLDDAHFRELLNPEDPRVVNNLPPTFLVTSGADFLKRYTLRLNEALAMAGRDHRLIYYPEGKELVHAFPSLHPELPQSLEVLDQLDIWFRGL